MKGRRKTGKDLIRSLTKSSGGTSYSITLPIAVVRKFRWNKHQKLQLPVDEKGEKIVIEDWPTK